MAEESNKRRRLSEALIASNVNSMPLQRGQPDAASSLAAALQSGGAHGATDANLARALMGGDSAGSQQQPSSNSSATMMASLLSGLSGGAGANAPHQATANSLDLDLARLLSATSQPQQAPQQSIMSLLSGTQRPAPPAASNPSADSILNLLGSAGFPGGNNQIAQGLLNTPGGGLQLNSLLQLVGGTDANSNLSTSASTDPLVQALANANAGTNHSQLLQALAGAAPAPTSAPNIADLLSQLQQQQQPQPPTTTADLVQQLQQGLAPAATSTSNTQDLLQHLQQIQQQAQQPPQNSLDMEILRQLQQQQQAPAGDLLQQLQRAQAPPQDNQLALLQQLQQLQQPGFLRPPAQTTPQQQSTNLLQQLQAAAAKDSMNSGASAAGTEGLASEISGLLHQLQQKQGAANTKAPSTLVSAKLSTSALANAPVSGHNTNTALMAFRRTKPLTKRTKKTKKRKANPTVAASPPLRKAPVGLTGHKPECLYMPCDDERLSAYHVLARKQIEFFEACEEDTSTNARGRNRPIVLGQVGIRCRHCASVPPRRRQRAAMYYPFKLDLLYQASQTLANVHLCEQCHHIPQEIKEELQRLRGDKTTALVGKKYWADGARIRGVYESEDGMRFEPPKKEEPKEESKVESKLAETTAAATTSTPPAAVVASSGAASMDP